MSNKLNKFESELKQVIEDYSPEYSNDSWSRLDKTLHKTNAYWYYIAATLLIIAGSVISYAYLDSNNLLEQKDKIQEQQYAEVLPDSLVHNGKEVKEEKISEHTKVLVEKTLKTIQEHIVKVEESKRGEGVLTEEMKEGETVNNKIAERVPQEITSNSQTQDKQNELIKSNSISPQIMLSSNIGCEPFDVRVGVSNLPKDAVISWQLSDGFKTKTESFNHQFTKNGKFTVKLTVSSSAGNFSAEEEIYVKKSPNVEFRFTETDGILNMENTTLDYDLAEWTFPGIKTDEASPSFEMLYSNDYLVSLKVTNAEGCVSEESKTVHYVVDHHIFAADAFTPDGDGVNDEFFIKYEPKEGYIYTLQIFNSSGKKLFETNEMNRGWDGGNATSNSKLNYEKYTWRLIIQDPRGRKDVQESTFRVLKH